MSSASSPVCPNCEEAVPVIDGAEPADALWLHARRCAEDALYPEVAVVCPECAETVPLPAGFSPEQALWLHEAECIDGIQIEIADAS